MFSFVISNEMRKLLLCMARRYSHKQRTTVDWHNYHHSKALSVMDTGYDDLEMELVVYQCY